MRKVLLATTALVAMGGVSAASADISISGSAHTTTSPTQVQAQLVQLLQVVKTMT